MSKLVVAALALAAFIAGALLGATVLAPATNSATPPTDDVVALTARVAELTAAKERADTSLERSERRATRLSERVVELEMKQSPQGPGEADGEGGTEDLSIETLQRELDKTTAETARTLAPDRETKGLRDLQSRVRDLRTRVLATKLRMLPEDERWSLAAEQVGLSPGQVEALKVAVSDRDRAWAEATEERRTPTADGVTIETIADTARVDEGQRVFDVVVRGNLDDAQHKKWNDLGFHGAFGRIRPTSKVSHIGSAPQPGR